MLKENEKNKPERENLMKTDGYPAYTTQVGPYLPVEFCTCVDLFVLIRKF